MYAEFPRQLIKVNLLLFPGPMCGLLVMGAVVVGVQPLPGDSLLQPGHPLKFFSYSLVFGGLSRACLSLYLGHVVPPPPRLYLPTAWCPYQTG